MITPSECLGRTRRRRCPSDESLLCTCLVVIRKSLSSPPPGESPVKCRLLFGDECWPWYTTTGAKQDGKLEAWKKNRTSARHVLYVMYLLLGKVVFIIRALALFELLINASLVKNEEVRQSLISFCGSLFLACFCLSFFGWITSQHIYVILKPSSGGLPDISISRRD